MSRAAVKEILEKIEALPRKDRWQLEQELAARADAEWTRLARQARVQARRRGIDQAAIDRAVERTRYTTGDEGLFRHKRLHRRGAAGSGFEN